MRMVQRAKQDIPGGRRLLFQPLQKWEVTAASGRQGSLQGQPVPLHPGHVLAAATDGTAALSGYSTHLAPHGTAQRGLPSGTAAHLLYS